MSEWADTPNVIARTVRRVIATRPMAWLLARTIHHVDGATLLSLIHISSDQWAELLEEPATDL